ncbi:hypothetical protein BO83DRAFT_349233 [Aspergillus eucalypticola CBS 122712]|uniref:Uncharacterized protein n=1 Tax=Aspergillus eucalypticola (strain CBS 122712 / IBT 29274) TaxID=1448314 RepID=A0A317URV1_ASPEC|nr:uncharacterized protein BO83DRAFT_349233 [Aspergillus eucalypticola CBS 122712]PWY62770.1 hypothetical protein BO83DRAFT_349233 [Aspergillus eucalypticola CBS 122712]
MRLHLIIQRHGLPVTRILWTTSPPSLFGHNAPSASSMLPAASSALASTRAPNALFSNGGYTIAQLLEDVNEVIPLETEPALFDTECSGQWGLEDYVVEVGGSECLHFMEVEGLLRDGDEILIRALQISDLRARRLSGRHQISSDGKHLIDGVPFGKPFLKRPTSSRPAITIPPRKKRRTSAAGWDYGSRYEEEDTEWAPNNQVGFARELPVVKSNEQPQEKRGDEYTDAYQDDYEDYHEPEDDGNGTVIRHAVDETHDQASESDSDELNINPEDLAEELKGLEEDLEISPMPMAEDIDVEQAGYPLRSRPSIHQSAPRKSSLAHASSQESSIPDGTRRDSKAVTFEDQKENPSVVESKATVASKVISIPEDATGSASDTSDSSSASDTSETSDFSDSEDSSNASDSSSDEDSGSEASTSDSEEDSSSDSDDDDDMSTSESEDELSDSDVDVQLRTKTNPPGAGSLRTKKSNERNKMRRRLAKLKELGALPAQADFAALRDWEEANGRSYYIPEDKHDSKEQERAEFEAKRQKLLRDLASGGVDVTEVKQKEIASPQSVKAIDQKQSATDVANGEDETEPPSKRRTLDVASSRRMLFGSLGVRTPRTKEDEEATRRKLAGKVNNQVQPSKSPKEDTVQAPESDSEENWQDKLILRATECIYDDIELTAPPFPFEQRWDAEAGDIIRQRKGWGKKRRRRQQLQVYDGDEGYENGDYGYSVGDYSVGDLQLNYDDAEQPNGDMEGVEHAAEQSVEEQFEDPADDLPALPNDPAALQDMGVDSLKKGSIIAFRQLEISKTTGWQPTVSGYRVAKIHEVFEHDIIKIRLAKRDRRESRDDQDWDEENDRPQYSGFEMPGMDEEEDDGFRELSFADLIEPKLLRSADTAGLGNAGKSSISRATEEPSPNETEATREYEDRQPLVRNVEREGTIPDEKSLNQKPVDHTEGPAEHSSPIKSPHFDGFQSPPADLTTGSKSSHEDQVSRSTPPAGQDSENGRNGRQPENAPEIKDPPSTLHSMLLPNDANDGGSAANASEDDLQMISSPVSMMSFNCLMETYFPPAVKRETSAAPAKEEPRSPSIVPNPFYEIDKAEEERQRRQASRQGRRSSNPDGGNGTMELMSLAGSMSPVPRPSPRVKSQAVEELSSISVVPESVPQPYQDDPEPSQLSEVVDLTQSSPPVSPGGSDEDYARSHRLPRGSGWVQKNIPRTLRVTRQSLGRRRNGSS